MFKDDTTVMHIRKPISKCSSLLRAAMAGGPFGVS